ncbi:MAG: hypothetical protein NWE89_07315 [Candidatus Bathyarchaeota archaeon]|nr:hypothetical protein [Candidatus Bathyarchaeota archaeon]
MAIKTLPPHAMNLLRATIYGDLKVILPRIGQYVHYPDVERLTGLNRVQTIQLLKDLWERGVLERRFHGMAYKCPHDDTTNLRPYVTCPICNSENLEIVPLIEHLGCGHVDMERKFIKGDEYVCPKDGKTLRLIGVDYRRPGVAYYCPECDQLFPEVNVKWMCNYANHVFTLQEAKQETMYDYLLNEDNREDVLRSFKFIEPLAEVFRRHGFDAKTYHNLTGNSGVTHLVDVYAVKLDKNPKVIICSVLSDYNIKPEEVLRLYATSLDTKPTMSILVAIPSLDDQSRVYSETLGLHVIEGETLRVVEEALEKTLHETA